MNQDWAPETRAMRAGRDDNGGALAPVLWASTTYEIAAPSHAARIAKTPRVSKFYARHGNPTVRAFEDAMAELEGAEASLAFASGMGAISTILLSLCPTGSHIVSQRQIYGGTLQWLGVVAPRLGIEVTMVDGTDPGAWAAAVRPGQTQVILAETPANPRLDLVDLDALGAIMGPIKVVDATVGTPLGQQPLTKGIDLVMHSATKAIGGHNDACLGVVSGEKELIDWIWGYTVLLGAVPSPFDAMNALRGLRSLGARFRTQSATAHALAEALEGHPSVRWVRYPGLASHPQYDLAKRTLRHFGGLLCFDLDGGREAVSEFLGHLKVARVATSFGGPETIVTHPATTTHAGLEPEELAEAGISEGTVRVSLGLEDTEDIVRDLREAIEASAPTQ